MPQKNLKTIIEWGKESLSSRGYTLKTQEPESIKHTPWSDVFRFETVIPPENRSV
jgi:hypothetical protein